MTEFNRTESAKWAIESQKTVGEFQDGKDKVLADAAGRGFPAAPGNVLAVILSAGQTVKDKLTEANGKIYDDRRGVIFQQEEFYMKTVVQVAKLSMELYRAELLNAIELEQAGNAALRERGRADVERVNAEIEARQVAIIRNRAEAERQVIGYKVLLAEAEKQTLQSEIALVQAQLATATKKLEIIDSIYQVLAAEELVLVAEQARVAALTLVLAAKEELAAVKMAMIPLYTDKASAKEALAAAITEEVPVKIAIENLGYERIGLKTAEAEVEHGIRQAELVLEVARQNLARANAATEVARAQSQVAIQGYANAAQITINEIRRAVGLAQVDTRMVDRLGRATMEIDDSTELVSQETANLTTEIASILANITSRAADDAARVKASSERVSKSTHTELLSRRIVEGVF